MSWVASREWRVLIGHLCRNGSHRWWKVRLCDWSFPHVASWGAGPSRTEQSCSWMLSHRCEAKKKRKKWFDVCNSSQFSKSVCVTCAKVCTYCVFWIKKECPPSCHNLSVLAWDSRSCQKEGVCAWFMQLNFTTKIYKSRVRGYERVKAGIKVNSR